jgi:hypothetical protein
MPPVVRNRRSPWELSEDDVNAALARLRERDEDLGREAEDVYGTLTWGEGPGQIRQAGVQNWLWYQVPTKYITDEEGYMGALAAAAAALFDELGLDAYAALCRSEVTAGVHAAFDRSDADGFKAMRKAMDGSGIGPPDLDDFAWGEVMGMDEALARTAVEDTLEAAIAEGDLVVGGRGWRARQQEITAARLDRDHSDRPGQSWRTIIVTERIGEWVRSAETRSEQVGRRRAGIANQLLHPLSPPDNIEKHLAPVMWLLDLFGDEQPLTQAGYLNRPFVVRVHEQHPWEDEYSTDRPPRTETDVMVLHRLRAWLEGVGALRKRGKVLRRTARGASMATDASTAWEVLIGHITADAWDRFVIETAAIVLLQQDRPMPPRDLYEQLASDAAELGWRTTDSHGLRREPSASDVTHAFYASWPLLELFGFVTEHGDWRNRTVSIPPEGRSTMLAIVRAGAAGPRSRSW